jgi:hypothetical protein
MRYAFFLSFPQLALKTSLNWLSITPKTRSLRQDQLQ